MATLIDSGPNDWQLEGELTFGTVSDLYHRGVALMPDGDLVVNLANVTRIDSAGLALLVYWQRQAESRQFRIEFSGVPEQLVNLAEVADLGSLMSFRNGVASA